jgi:regulator of cell morphogenesis and NO signaling
MIDATSSVRSVAQSHPGATRLFALLGIDYCCRAERSLAAAAVAANVDRDELIDLLSRRAPEIPPVTDKDWFAAPLTEIADVIVKNYHRRARRFLVDLLDLVDRLLSAHAAARPELWTLRATLEELGRDLIPHMAREEQYLFPYIKMLEHPVAGDQPVIIPLSGSVEYPLQGIRHDHSHDLEYLARIRSLGSALTSGDQCGRLARFIALLADFDRDLTRHIKLENDVLFPRAVELERAIARRKAAT